MNNQIKRNKLMEEVPKLQFKDEVNYSSIIEKYFDLYRLNFLEAKHFFGYFESHGNVIASHIFIPMNATVDKMVVVMHGYLDHAGNVSNLIKVLLESNYAVAVYDMPGHGLSTGKTASIKSFANYALVLGDFIKIIKSNFDLKISVVAHSTGCAAVYEFLSTTKKLVFDKIIFLAPLVRSKRWSLSCLANFLASPFVNSVPRKFRKNSSNTKYLTFQKTKDFLQPRHIPLTWLSALINWYKEIQSREQIKSSILIIQGKQDVTVDWKYNLSFFKKKISDTDVKWIDGANHQLINESISIQKSVFTFVLAKLDQ